MLRRVDGESRLGLEQTDGIPVVRMSPDKEVSGYGIPAIDVNFYRIFMWHPQIVSRKETAAAPRLLSGREGRLLYTKGTRVFTKGLIEPGRYLTYRIDRTSPIRIRVTSSVRKSHSAASCSPSTIPTLSSNNARNRLENGRKTTNTIPAPIL